MNTDASPFAGKNMKVVCRIGRLEERAPKQPRRIILLWIDREGRRTKVADTHPHLPDPGEYDSDISGCHPGGGIEGHVAQTD